MHHSKWRPTACKQPIICTVTEMYGFSAEMLFIEQHLGRKSMFSVQMAIKMASN
jgi:hypothetical protein